MIFTGKMSKRVKQFSYKEPGKKARKVVGKPDYGRRPGMRRRRTAANIRTAGFLGIENKFYDTSLGATALLAPTDAAGAEVDPSTTSMISTPAVGDSEQNRDGKRIVINSVQIRGFINAPGALNQTTGQIATSVYVALVLDTQTNGAQMNSEDCFKNTGAAAILAASPMRNLLFGPRFKILKSWLINSEAPSLTYDGTNIEWSGWRKDFDCFLKVNIPVNFNAGTTASVANVIDNSLHIIAYTSNASTAPTIGYNARIRFVG